MHIPQTKLQAQLTIRWLKQQDKLYHDKGKPKVSDRVYDQVKDATYRLLPKHLYFQATGSPVAEGQPKVTLTVPMPSLNKKRPHEADAWINEQPADAEFCVTPKLDGLALQLVYTDGVLTSAARRGDGEIGHLVLNNAKHIHGVQHKLRSIKHYRNSGTLVIDGEVIIEKGIFDKHFAKDQGGKYSAARNFAVGMLRKEKLTEADKFALSKMMFVAFGCKRVQNGKPQYPAHRISEWIELGARQFVLITNPTRKKLVDLGNKKVWRSGLNPIGTYFYSKRDNNLSGQVLIAKLKQWREQYDFHQDGVVLELNQHDYRKGVGSSARPSFAYAVKPDIVDQVRQRGVHSRIEWNITSRGIYSPVAILDKPMNFDGAKISRATINNARMFRDLKCGQGAVVEWVRSGDVIPRIVKVIKPGKHLLPMQCDYCKTKLKLGDVHLYCPNKDCWGAALKRLEHFFSVVKVDGMRGQTLAKLAQAKINTVPKILTVTPKQLSRIEGFGERSCDKLLQNIQTTLSKLTLPKLMHASGCFQSIEMGSLGHTLLEAIVEKLGQATVLTKPYESKSLQMKVIGPNIGEVRAKLFVDGLAEFREFYKTLDNISLNLKNPKRKKSGPLAGKIFCFTHFRPDDATKQFIEDNGGECTDSFTQRVTVLFAAGSSSKTARAERVGIPVIEQGKMMAYLNQAVKG